MYGTVARLRVKPGGLEELKKWSPQENDGDRGAVAIYAFQMDDDPDEVLTVAIFESKEAYAANAGSPEQDARYRQMLGWLEGEPEWNDGEIVFCQLYQSHVRRASTAGDFGVMRQSGTSAVPEQDPNLELVC